VRAFRQLLVWQKAHALTLALYKVTKSFPRDEQYGLTAQIRRAAVSVAANLAEGCGRRTAADFGRFVQIALGSASELEYHLVLAADLGLLPPAQHTGLDSCIVEVKRMLTGLAKKLMADG
jgi:four helix bundle protein